MTRRIWADILEERGHPAAVAWRRRRRPRDSGRDRIASNFSEAVGDRFSEEDWSPSGNTWHGFGRDQDQSDCFFRGSSSLGGGGDDDLWALVSYAPESSAARGDGGFIRGDGLGRSCGDGS